MGKVPTSCGGGGDIISYTRENLLTTVVCIGIGKVSIPTARYGIMDVFKIHEVVVVVVSYSTIENYIFTLSTYIE